MIDGIEPTVELLTVVLIGTEISIDEHVCLLVTEDIATDSLTEDCRIAIDIEVVVLQLEGESDLLTEDIEVLTVGYRSIGEYRTYLDTEGKYES